jgi:hypothetical protein
MSFKSDLKIPKEFICPLGWELMSDPVICSDGVAYERKNIEKWLLEHDTSPVTNEKLLSKELLENSCLKKSIEQFCGTLNSHELDKSIGQIKACISIQSLIAAERARARAEAEAECIAHFHQELARVKKAAEKEKENAVAQAIAEVLERQKNKP